LADAQPDIIALMEKRIGYLPFIRCAIQRLPEECAKLKQNADYRKQWGEVGREYWEDYHSPPVVAQRAVEVFEEAIDLWQTTE
jgi:hypothetical protein